MKLGLEKQGSSIGDEAATWAARLEQDRSPETLLEFQRWNDADPRHAEAFDVADAMLRDVSRLRHSPAFASRQLKSGRLRPRAREHLSLAASIALIVFAIPALYLMLTRPPGVQGIQAVMLSTEVGQVRQFPLADGTRVTLDTASAVRVEIGEGRRQAVLEHGRARFIAARRNVPLSVRVGRAAVSMDEGTLDISDLGGMARVDLVAGSASIVTATGPQPQQLKLNARMTVEQPGTPTQRVLPLEQQEVEWVSGRLSFSGASLGDVVAAANRYTHQQIIVRDPSVAALRVSGVFRPGDASGLAKSLARSFGLRLEQGADGNIILVRPAP